MNRIEYEYPGNPIPATRPRLGRMGAYNTGHYARYKDDLSFHLSLRFANSNVPLPPPCKLTAFFYRGSRTRCDLDNLLKGLMDSLQESGLIANDSDIDEVRAKKLYDKENPRVWFELTRKDSK